MWEEEHARASEVCNRCRADERFPVGVFRDGWCSRADCPEHSAAQRQELHYRWMEAGGLAGWSMFPYDQLDSGPSRVSEICQRCRTYGRSPAGVFRSGWCSRVDCPHHSAAQREQLQRRWEESGETLPTAAQVEALRWLEQWGCPMEVGEVLLERSGWDANRALRRWFVELPDRPPDRARESIQPEEEPPPRTPEVAGPALMAGGYVVVYAEHARGSRGFHQCSWWVLEGRLNVTPGSLAGNLASHGVGVSRVGSYEAALERWQRASLPEPMPFFP